MPALTISMHRTTVLKSSLRPPIFSAVREALEAAGYTFLSAEQDMIPSNTVDVNDPEMIAKIERMLDMFDDNDDVQEVFHNAILPEEEDED